MQSIIFALLSGAVALSSAYTTPVGDEPMGNAIMTPAMGEPVPAGRPYTIKWDPTTEGTVTILLLRGPSTNIKPLYPIVEVISNLGSYIWTPSTSLEADVTGYGIQIIDDETGQYQYSAQFGIKNENPTTSSSASSISSAAYGPVTPAPSVSSEVTTGTMGFGNGTTYNVTATANVTVCTYCPSNSSSMYIAPTGAPIANSSVVLPTGNMTIPSTLRASTTVSRTTTPPASATASASPSASSGAAGQLVRNLGGVAVGALGAMAIFL